MECHLGVGELLRLEGGSEGVVLHCLKGTIWLTQGDGVDRLVQRGLSFRLAAGATAIVEALDLAELRLDASPCRPALRPVRFQQSCRALG